MAIALLQRSAQLVGRASHAHALSGGRRIAAGAPPAGARGLHATVAQAAVVGQDAKAAEGTQLGTQNGTTSVSIEEGWSPFEEVKAEFPAIQDADIGRDGVENSLARDFYSPEVEKAVNEMIAVHFGLFYAYNAMSSYFARDNVALLGLSTGVFRRFADQQYGHALVFQDYQAKRGGRTSFGNIPSPQSSYAHGKGDALYAMHLSLGYEKLLLRKLREMHAVCDEADDAQASDFVESRLTDQVQHVRIVADSVAELRRAGKGHGTWHYDRLLREQPVDVAANYTTNPAGQYR